MIFLRHAPAFALGLAVLCADAPGALAEGEPSRERAVRGAIASLQGDLPEDDPIAWLSLAILDRRFELGAFAGLGERYREELAAAEGADRRKLRVFLRLIEPGATVEAADLAAITEGIDLLTSRALHCDRLGLPEDFELTLRSAIGTGGYLLTHAGLALQWIEENGCDTPWSRRLRVLVVQRMALIPDADERLTDFELEAATFLSYMDREDLLPPGFVESVLAVQRPDGGWSPDSALEPEEVHWHATSLALWLLLEQDTAERVPMIPRP